MSNLEFFFLFFSSFSIDFLKEILTPGKSSETSNGPWRIYLVSRMLALHELLGQNSEQEELVVNIGADNVWRSAFQT